MRNERIPRHSTIRHMPATGGAADRRQVSATRGSTYGRPALLGAYHTPFLLLPATADADRRDGDPRSSRDASRRHAADAPKDPIAIANLRDGSAFRP